jgi:hypothetical protein
VFAGIAQLFWPSPWYLLLWSDFEQRIRAGLLALAQTINNTLGWSGI